MYRQIQTFAAVLVAGGLAACDQHITRAVPQSASFADATAAGAPIYSGTENDYQPSLLRAADGRLMVALERLAPRTNSGDLFLSTSADNGATWSVPALVVGGKLNERHPSLVQLASGGFALFFMQVDSRGGYSIRRATSPDGRTWTQQGAVNLGWGTAGDMNPSVIVEADGSLTMTYQRSNGTAYVGYVARSTDGGATWDARRTSVSGGGAGMLPRIARRASDGLYMAVFQRTGADGQLAIFARTSADPYAWTSAPVEISAVSNAHDAQPIVLEDGRFLVTYVAVGGDSGFNVYYRTSDGTAWTAPVKVTTDIGQYDVQPHPVLHGTPGRVILAWGRQRAVNSDYDIWVNNALDIQ